MNRRYRNIALWVLFAAALVVLFELSKHPLPKGLQGQMGVSPPRWLFWLFLACVGALAFRLSTISLWMVVQLVLANVIFQAWDGWREGRSDEEETL